VIFMTASCDCLQRKVMKDNYLFLENTKDQKTQDFIKKENLLVDEKLISDSRYTKVEKGVMKILDDKDKIPAPEIFGDYVYTTWKDKKNPLGLIRRMKFQDYMKYGAKNSLSSKWEIVLDLDKHSKKDKKTWVLKEFSVFPNNENRAIFKLSDGGKDASYLREYDFKKKAFIEANDGGFYLPENKFFFDVINKDQIQIATALEGDFVSSAKYPLEIKQWNRGSEYNKAKTVFRGEKNDLWAWGFCPVAKDAGFDCLYGRGINFYKGQITLKKDDILYPVEIDQLIKFQMSFKGKLYFQVKQKTEEFEVGDIVSLSVKDVYQKKFDLSLFYRPTDGQSVESLFSTKNHLYIVMNENVVNQLYRFTHGKLSKIDFPPYASISITGVDAFDSRDEFFLYDQSFLRPYGLFLIDRDQKAKTLRKKKSLFNSKSMLTEQYWATSKDGTKVPYFVVHQKNMKLDSSNPTWIYAYGGFESSMTPWYSGAIGKYWVDKGGVYVLANIRGGGEFGPAWHRQALKENRYRTYDDYFAIAEDLIKRGITKKGLIGISGGSNGGLLTGVGLTQRPDLYGAVVSAAPLLDMFRYHKLPPGDSWVAEYGNVEKNSKVFDFWSKYSPYQALNAKENYPPTLIMTSTSDDRVHPGHARKMAAKMRSYNKNMLFFENVQGGHSGSADLKQRARQSALIYTFFYKNLMNQ
jgi:prolyl oligopeptidase